MPARQDQTLQIFLIIFIFLFLISAVVAYLGWKGYGEAEQRATALQSSLNDKNTQTQNQQTELEDMREWMGFGRNDNTPDVKTAFETDMKNMGAGVADEASRSYRKVLEAVYTEGQQTAAREADLKAQLTENKKQLLAVESEKEKQVVEFKKKMDQAAADKATLTNEFTEDRTKLESTKSEIADESRYSTN